MNGFDILVLIVVGISALLAFARGFVREVLSMAALVIGILAAVWGLSAFREPVREMIKPSYIADTTTVVGIFLLVYIAVRVLTGRIHEWVHDSEPLGILDRTAGILFGVARGFIIASIPVLLVHSIAKKDKYPKIIIEAQFYPFLAITADVVKNFTPSATQSATDFVKNAGSAGEEVARWRDQAEMIKDAGEIIEKSKILKPEDDNINKSSKDKESQDSKESLDNSLKVEKK